jgi:hypothetical protein
MTEGQKPWFIALGAALAGGLTVALWPRSAAAAAPATSPSCPPCPSVPPCPSLPDPPALVEPADVVIYGMQKFTKTYDPDLAYFVKTVRASDSQAAVIDAFNSLPGYSPSDGAAVIAIDPVTGRTLWFRGWDGSNLIITGDPARVAALRLRRVQPGVDPL